MRYVRVPLDEFLADPLRRSLALRYRATFDGLYLVARHRPPRLGYLLDGRGRPMQPSHLARLLAVPDSTFRDHFGVLNDAALVARDLSNEWFVPLVQDLEAKLSAETTRARDGAQNTGRAPENASLLDLLTDPRPPPEIPVGREDIPTGRDAKIEMSSSVPKDVLRGLSGVSDPERPPVEAVAAGLGCSDRVAYMLTRLAEVAAPWARLLSTPSEFAQLRELHRGNRDGVIAALEQVYLKADSVKKPVAWLRATAPRLALAPVAAGLQAGGAA